MPAKFDPDPRAVEAVAQLQHARRLAAANLARIEDELWSRIAADVAAGRLDYGSAGRILGVSRQAVTQRLAARTTSATSLAQCAG